MDKIMHKGTVKPYTGNGRKLGYPTANIEVPADAKEGVFAGYTKLGGEELPSIIFVGAPITMNDPIKRGESHILDFSDRDLYGEEVVFTIVHKIRGNQMFDSEAELLNYMKVDEQEAREYFSNSD